jgi:hypothetical protein
MMMADHVMSCLLSNDDANDDNNVLQEEAARPEMQGVRVSLTFRKSMTFFDPATERISGQGEEYQTPNWPLQLGGEHVRLAAEEIEIGAGEEEAGEEIPPS